MIKERKQVTEESGIQNQWYERASKITLAELPEFMRELSEDYLHDYGTICHAVAASGIAAMKAFDRGPCGGITGFQAGAVIWQVIDAWGAFGKGPKRIINYEDLLYPAMEDKFNEISQDTWEWVQDEAKKRLREDKPETWAPRVREHMEGIARGETSKLPFGYTVKGK